jgi:nucleotide-binding universal stress UspA family protein
MKKILFPTDFSKTAGHAFKYAQAFAQEINGIIDVMHVFHLPIADAGSIPPHLIDELLAEQRRNALLQLKQFTQDCPDDLLGSLKADYGLFVFQEVTDTARHGHYDLIIMGTKGTHNQLETLLGSVTTHIMMQGPCPVLAIPEGALYQGISRIAYATDFESSDQPAVEMLIEFASLLTANIHFVHVESKSSEEETNLTETMGESPLLFTDFTVIKSSSVMEGLDHYIEDAKIDVLALFIPRRRLWERLFHSSFTKKMAFHSQTPLMVFHG